MNTTSRKDGTLLSRLLPEQRIYIKSEDDQTRYLRLSSRTQAAIGGVFLAAVGWTVVSSSALVLGMVNADDEAHQAQVIQEAYEKRIAVLSEERDQRTQEAASMQERFNGRRNGGPSVSLKG